MAAPPNPCYHRKDGFLREIGIGIVCSSVGILPNGNEEVVIRLQRCRFIARRAINNNREK